MSLFDEKLKNIPLKELLILILILFIIQFIVSSLNIFHIKSVWIYICIIFYFIFKLRGTFSSFRQDLSDVFQLDLMKCIFLIVLLNIFLSYGLLYLSDIVLNAFPDMGKLISFQLFPVGVNSFLVAAGSFIATVIVSPISEELIFRGVLLNKFRLIMPAAVSILFTSLLFASMHPYGSIISAFVFAVCMAILYIKTNNILVAISAHFLNNLIAESIVFLDAGNILFTNNLVMGIMSILAIVSAAILVISIIGELNNIK